MYTNFTSAIASYRSSSSGCCSYCAAGSCRCSLAFSSSSFVAAGFTVKASIGIRRENNEWRKFPLFITPVICLRYPRYPRCKKTMRNDNSIESCFNCKYTLRCELIAVKMMNIHPQIPPLDKLTVYASILKWSFIVSFYIWTTKHVLRGYVRTAVRKPLYYVIDIFSIFK